MKYLAVTGGVVSGLGKGITISSIGVLLKSYGLRVTSIKIDPYLNKDAGTMSPFEHGEVFVLDDGGEADLDLGNYERFLNINLTRNHNITTGKVYDQVIRRERRGDYLGKTVQVVPHVTNAIQDWIEQVAILSVDGQPGSADICLIEVGGTVGDIESMVFLEALRQFQFRVGPDNFCLVHVSLVPVLGSVGEQKTKPTQHGVKELRSVGLAPNIIICRSGTQLEDSTKRKLSLFCQVPTENVLAVHDVSNIYHVPLILRSQNIADIIFRQLNLAPPRPQPDLVRWEAMAHAVDNYSHSVKIALVGKYTGLFDSYLSVIKALKHGSMHVEHDLEIIWIEAADLEIATKETRREAYDEAWAKLRSVQGIMVPGGFGDRGVEGKIVTIQYARENRVPVLGVCLGLQMMVVEHARNVLGWAGANSTEFEPNTPHPMVIFMPEINPDEMGGTMRLGARMTILGTEPEVAQSGSARGNSMARSLYGCASGVNERHRHRYEVNPEKVAALKAAGLRFSGMDDRKQRMEIVELDRSVHPFFLGVQYHPEFRSHPQEASPPFLGFIMAAVSPDLLTRHLAEMDEKGASYPPTPPVGVAGN